MAGEKVTKIHHVEKKLEKDEKAFSLRTTLDTME